jgi:hypothetical protein
MVDDTGIVSRPWNTLFSRWQAILSAIVDKGTTANRPTSNLWLGRIFYDTTLQAPVYLQSYPPAVWVPFGGGGGGGSTQGKHGIYVSAVSMRQSIVSGCQGLNPQPLSSNQPDLLTLNFDPTAQEYAQFSVALPKKWNKSTVTFQPYWSHQSTTTNFGVVWSLQGVAVHDAGAIGTSYGTAVNVTDTGGTANSMYIAPESAAITISNTPVATDMIFFRMSRVATDGADTLAVDARLHGIMLFITTNADTDA